ncbi:hypothetical protein LCGC14_2596280, partial [marine sediment metagenome]
IIFRWMDDPALFPYLGLEPGRYLKNENGFIGKCRICRGEVFKESLFCECTGRCTECTEVRMEQGG